MDEKDKNLNKSGAANVQMHEMKQVSEGMSFGALLDKFYMNSELGKEMAKTHEKSAEVKAQELVTPKKPQSGNS